MTDNPSSQAMVDKYFTEASSGYGKQSEKGIWFKWKQREFEAVRDYLAPLKGCSFLEVGCGAGWYLKRLAADDPGLYVASDRLLPMLRQVPKEYAMPLAADLCALPLRTKFDRILCAGALEFVQAPKSFIAEAARVLNPGGRLVLLVPSDGVFGCAYKAWHRTHGCRITLFSERRLTDMASELGLKVSRATRPALFTLVVAMNAHA